MLIRQVHSDRLFLCLEERSVALALQQQQQALEGVQLPSSSLLDDGDDADGNGNRNTAASFLSSVLDTLQDTYVGSLYSFRTDESAHTGDWQGPKEDSGSRRGEGSHSIAQLQQRLQHVRNMVQHSPLQFKTICEYHQTNASAGMTKESLYQWRQPSGPFFRRKSTDLQHKLIP